MAKNRIEYIDALRGFTMYLVVYTHVVNFCFHIGDVPSFNNILKYFFLSLFFFISGFFAFKSYNNQISLHIKTYIKNKAIQLLIPSIVFGTLFCYNRYSLHEALGPPKGGYWFTIQLFIFFLFYLLTIIVGGKKTNSIKFDALLIFISFIIFAISFSHTIIQRTQIGAELFYYLGVKNWRYYIFFCFGILVRKHFMTFLRLTDSNWMALVVICFFAMVLWSDGIIWPLWKPIKTLLYGGLSIVVIFSFFRKYESAFVNNKPIGYCLQYIGRRTLDIYMIHYFLLPRNLHIIGDFFSNNNNPLVEFLVTSSASLLVILISIIIGNIIRLSPLLCHYLLGTK